MATLESQIKKISDLLDEALARTVRMVVYRPANTAIPESLNQLKSRIKMGKCPQLNALLKQQPFNGATPELHEHWIAESLQNAKTSIAKIDTRKVASFRWQRTNTQQIFQDHITSSQSAFVGSVSSVMPCISQRFSAPDDYKPEGIEELAQLSELAKKIQRRLKILKSRFLSFVYSPSLLATLVIILALSIPATYYVVAAYETHNSDPRVLQQSVDKQLKAHTEQLKAAAVDKPGKDFWTKLRDISKAVKEIVGNAKTTIATIFAIWALIIKRLGR